MLKLSISSGQIILCRQVVSTSVNPQMNEDLAVAEIQLRALAVMAGMPNQTGPGVTFEEAAVAKT